MGMIVTYGRVFCFRPDRKRIVMCKFWVGCTLDGLSGEEMIPAINENAVNRLEDTTQVDEMPFVFLRPQLHW